MAVQRGTMHAWSNRSDTEWCRMLYVLLPATGTSLVEDYGDMQGVPKST